MLSCLKLIGRSGEISNSRPLAPLEATLCDLGLIFQPGPSISAVKPVPPGCFLHRLGLVGATLLKHGASRSAEEQEATLCCETSVRPVGILKEVAES